MKDTPNVRESLDRALMDITNAQNLLAESLRTAEETENRHSMQNTYDSVSQALEAVRNADYRCKAKKKYQED